MLSPVRYKAIATARNANPQVSGYVWAAAAELVCAPELRDSQVAIVLEMQLYLVEFLRFKMMLHLPYRIERAGNLLALAQDCGRWGNAPELEVATGASTRPTCMAGHVMASVVSESRTTCGVCGEGVHPDTRFWLCWECSFTLCNRCRKRGITAPAAILDRNGELGGWDFGNTRLCGSD